MCCLLRCLLEGHTDAVLCIAADADGYIYTGSDDEKIRVWDTNDSWRCVQVGSHCALLRRSILAVRPFSGAKAVPSEQQSSPVAVASPSSVIRCAEARLRSLAFGFATACDGCSDSTRTHCAPTDRCCTATRTQCCP